jgi:hypothetical protein
MITETEYEKANEIDWSYEISCPECDQIIMRNLYIRDFDNGKGVASSTQTLMAEHILNAHQEELVNE